ncbi:BZ3500_MvSof-1268-A1-R1_Chr12-3g04041 [Microbotryum saponariae]|uniref:BZ3500_MvSof-1268-A1-R1_Chr12-3g04041 protein n=1 Tax=Microbotryum saponariae TaxID=289078 RepID=A0A2X0NC38_9BASI|nr:BZ3500_MvSof-1268-A1-R1_Chr12-3g04041 [Microbotryum saponariae]SDA02587.1 BZ3501_MvSof-1269-A2-R1_Chr12-3g03696 [Microbotryum saponariae]
MKVDSMRKRRTLKESDYDERGSLGDRFQTSNPRRSSSHKLSPTAKHDPQAPSKTDGAGSASSGSGSDSDSGSGSPSQGVPTAYVNANSSVPSANGTTIVQGPVTIVVIVSNNPSSTSTPSGSTPLNSTVSNNTSTTELPTAPSPAPIPPTTPNPNPTSSDPITSTSSNSPLVAPNSLSSSSSKHLSHGDIAGIVVGSLVGLSLLVLLVLWAWKKCMGLRRRGVYEDSELCSPICPSSNRRRKELTLPPLILKTPPHPDTALTLREKLKGPLLPSGIQSDLARLLRDM